MPRPPSPPRRIVLEGRMHIGGQEHFYLEGQVAFAVPGEDDDVTVHCSTQHPSEIQHKVAHVLGVPSHAVTVEMRRMGGGFGGKETQGNLPAAASAAGRQADRPARQVLLRPRRRHDHHRQAPRLPHRLRGRLRRRAAASCGIEYEQAAALRLVGRPLLRHRRPRHVPRRQRLLSAGGAHHLATAARRTPCPTPPSAASAARRAWWRSSG